MAPIRADLSGVQSNNFKVHPAGDYPGRIVKMESTTSKGPKTKGKPMLKAQIRFADVSGSVFDNLIIDADSLWKFKMYAVAAGIPEDDLSGQIIIGTTRDLDDDEYADIADAVFVNVDDIVGADVLVTIGIDPPQNGYDEKNVVKRVRPIDDYNGTTTQASSNSWGD